MENSGIKLSIIFTVYNSHEVVKRQIRYFHSLNLPDDIEIIIMDDGSLPPLEFPGSELKNFNIYQTGNTAPWTQALARNQSIKKARGEMLLFTDIDHFFPLETIMAVKNFDGDKMFFKREHAILNAKGRIKQDKKTLIKYGLKRRIRRGQHNNSFAMRKSVYLKLGGYSRKYWENRFHRSGDSNFYSRYERMARRGKVEKAVISHNKIYSFPEPNRESLGIFHNLSRQNEAIKDDKPVLKERVGKFMAIRQHKPVAVSKIEKTRYQGHHTICQFLRDIYSLTGSEDIKLKCRIGMSMAKSMHEQLKKYKKAEIKRQDDNKIN